MPKNNMPVDPDHRYILVAIRPDQAKPTRPASIKFIDGAWLILTDNNGLCDEANETVKNLKHLDDVTYMPVLVTGCLSVLAESELAIRQW